MRNQFIAVAFVATLAIGSLSAHGAIVGTTGTAELISTPADARLDVLTSLTAVRVWNERQNVLLTSDLRVDATATGLYNELADLPAVQPIIPVGTLVSSHFVHLDTPGSLNSGVLTGSVTFDADVVGLVLMGDEPVVTPQTLDMTDFLGAPTLYDDGITSRSLDLQVGDSVLLSADRRTITFTMRGSQPGDRFRVITVPAPSALAFLAGMTLCGTGRRRR